MKAKVECKNLRLLILLGGAFGVLEAQSAFITVGAEDSFTGFQFPEKDTTLGNLGIPYSSDPVTISGLFCSSLAVDVAKPVGMRLSNTLRRNASLWGPHCDYYWQCDEKTTNHRVPDRVIFGRERSRVRQLAPPRVACSTQKYYYSFVIERKEVTGGWNGH